MEPPSGHRSDPSHVAELRAHAQRLTDLREDTATAAGAWRAVLTHVPDDEHALRTLGSLCTALRDWEEVARISERLSEVAAQPADRLLWRVRTGQLWAQRLGRSDEAAVLLIDSLDDGAEASGLVETLQQLAANGVRSAEIACALARRSDRADAAAARTSDIDGLERARLEHRAAQRWTGLTETLRKLGRCAPTAQSRASAWREAAAVYEQHLADSEGALAAWREAAARLPRDRDAVAAIERLATQLNRAEDIAFALDLGRVQERGSPEGRERAVRLAVLRAEKLSDPAGAIALCTEVLREDPAHLQARETLAACVESPAPWGPQALAALDPICEAEGDHARRAELREIRLRVAGAEEKPELVRALMSLYEGPLGDDERALLAGMQAFAARIDREGLAPGLERLSIIASTEDEVAEVFEAAAEELLPGDPGCSPLLRRAARLRERAGQPDAAAKLWSEVLADSPGDAEALEHLGTIYQRDGRDPALAFATWRRAFAAEPGNAAIRAGFERFAQAAGTLDELAAAYEDCLDHQPDAEFAGALWHKVAEAREALGRAEEAAAAWEEISRREPENAAALQAVARLYQALGRNDAYARALMRQAALPLESEVRADLFFQAAWVADEMLGDPALAAECYRHVLAENPEDRGALKSLEKVLSAGGRLDELAAVLQTQLQLAQRQGTPDEQADVLVEVGRAALQRNRLSEAGAAFQRALEAAPGHSGAVDVLESIALSGGAFAAEAGRLLSPVIEGTGDLARMARLLRAQLTSPDAATDRVGVLQRLNQISTGPLADPSTAFMAAASALRDAPEAAPLLDATLALAERAGAFEELCALLEEITPRAKTAEARVRLSVWLARIEEKAGETDSAARAWQRVISEVPDHAEALDRLEALLGGKRQFAELAELFDRRLAKARTPEERLGVLRRLAEAQAAGEQGAAAVETLRAALEIKPDDSLFAALERLLGQQGQYQEQASVLRQLASRAVEPSVRRELLSRAGEALLKSGHPDSAAEAYAAALATDPADAAAIAGLESLLDSPSAKARAAKALEPVYRGRKDAAHLAVVLENSLTEARPEARPTLFKEIAALRESLGQNELAFASLLAAFAEAPADVRVRADLHRLAAVTGSFGELADEVASQLERPLPPALALELWRTQAELFSGPVGRPDRATAAWREVAQRAPGDPEALDQLELLYQAQSEFESLFGLLAERAERAAATERPALFLRMAQLAAERLNDPARAVDACRQALVIDPGDAGAATLLEGLLEETGRTAELVARLEERIRALHDGGNAAELADLEVRAAELTQNDGPRSLALLRGAFAAQPAHAGATDLAERMMRPGGPMRGEAAALLQPLYEARGDMARVAEALQARADTEADTARRVELLHRLTELQAGPLWNPQAAFSAAAAALTALPDDVRALRDCLQWHEVAGRTDALVALLEETAPRATDARQRSETLRGLGMLQEGQGSDAKAIDTWRGLLAVEPADAPALERLGRLLDNAKRWEELLEVLRRQLELADTDERRATLLRRMAVLRQDALGDAEGALETFRKLRALRPDDPEALERMDGLCEAASQWNELEQILERRVGSSTAPGPTAMALELRLAALRLEKLGKGEDAVPLYAGILARDPRQATALARLEGMSTSGGGDGRVLDVLLEAYRASGDNVRRAAALEARAAVAAPADRRPLLLELAECRGALGQTDLAFLALARCFQENPGDADVFRRLKALADAAHMIDALVDICAEVVPQLEGKPAAALCLELARLCEEQLSEPDAAVEWLTRARSLDQAAPVLEGLARLYDQLQRWAPLADVVEEQAAHTEDPSHRLALLMRLGKLCEERLADPGHATIAYQLALKADPGCLDAASALEQLQGQAGQFQHQLATLDHIRERTRGVHREQVTLRMAEVARDGTHDTARAIELCRALLHDNPRSDPGFELLASLLGASQRHQELKTLFEARIAWTFDPRALAGLHEQLGLLVRDALHDLPGAVAHLEAAVSREPRRESALEALWQAREQLGAPAECVAVLQRLAPLREGPAAKVAWLRLAELLVQTGGLGSEALDAAKRALALGPHEAADLQRLLALFQGLAAHEEATTVLEAQADAAAGQNQVADAVRCLFSAVALREKQARSAEVASLLEKIIALAPDEQRAYRELSAICVRLEDWPGYAACLERWLPHLSSPAERLRISLDLAGAQERQLGDPLAAFATLQGAFRLAPADDALLEGLERLARVTGSSDALAGVLKEISAGLGNTPLAARRLLALARIADEDLDDVPRATEAIERVLELQPRELAAFERLANLHARRGLFPGQVEALERKREALSRAEDRKTLDREIARVREELIGDAEGAAAALTRALQTEPDLQTAVALVGVRRRAGRWAEAARALQLARDLAPDLSEKVQFQLDAAVLQERELDDDGAAIDAYRKALDMDARCRPALDALARLYRSGDGPLDANRARELLRIHQRQLDLAGDDGERVALWVKCAALREDPLADPSGADACFESILALDPRNRHALESLIRIRGTQRRWPELINALERLAKAATTRAERASAHAQVGAVLRDGMSDPDRAIASYHKALELEPSDRAVVHSLGALYASRAQWPRALEMLQREAVLLGAKPEAAELHRQAGDIHLERLNDPSGAKACYRQALQVDSGHLAAIRALQRLHAREHDWRAYESMLIAEAEHLGVAAEKRDAYLRVARHVAEKRHDVPGAKQWYEAALGADPECIDAAAPLAAQAVEGEDWARAEELILLIARKAEARAGSDPRAAPEAARELFRLGDVYARRAKETDALDALQRAARLDPHHQAAQERLAALYVDLDRKQEAVTVYEDLLTRFAKQLSLSSATSTRCRVAELLSEMGQSGPARAHFERVLGQVPGNERALRGLTRLADQSGDHRSAASFRQKWLKVLSGEARFQVAVELARLAGEVLGDHGLQVEACREALKVKPDALSVMESLAQAYAKVGQHDRSAQTLRMILDHPELKSDVDRRKRAYFQLGDTVGTHLRDVEGAAAAFEAALDLDYRFVQPFRALEALLASAKRWRALDEAYGRMLDRVPDSGDGKAIRTSLWKARGDVRAHALNDPGEALQAYRTAAEGRPDDAAMQEALGDFAARRPGEEQTALTAFRRALTGTADMPKVCSAIAELSGKLHDYDTTYLATHVLVEVLRSGSESERATLRLLVPHADAAQRASRSLTDRLWKDPLFHEGLRGPLAEIAALLFEHASAAWAVPHAAYHISPKKHRVDLYAGRSLPTLANFQHVAGLLGTGHLDVFSPCAAAAAEDPHRPRMSLPDHDVDIEPCWTSPLCVRLGGRFFNETAERALRARVAFALAFLRPELAPARALSIERLEAVLEAAMGLAGVAFSPIADLKAVKKERKHLERALGAPARAALHNLGRQYGPIAKRDDVKRYVRAAEMTAMRAAVVATSDVATSVHAVVDGRGTRVNVPRDEAVRDLIAFALGGGLRILRAAVGTALDVTSLPSSSDRPSGTTSPFGPQKLARA